MSSVCVGCGFAVGVDGALELNLCNNSGLECTGGDTGCLRVKTDGAGVGLDGSGNLALRLCPGEPNLSLASGCLSTVTHVINGIRMTQFQDDGLVYGVAANSPIDANNATFIAVTDVSGVNPPLVAGKIWTIQHTGLYHLEFGLKDAPSQFAANDGKPPNLVLGIAIQVNGTRVSGNRSYRDGGQSLTLHCGSDKLLNAGDQITFRYSTQNQTEAQRPGQGISDVHEFTFNETDQTFASVFEHPRTIFAP